MIPGAVAHLWQSTFFVAAAWLVALSLRKNRAQLRYQIWFVASAKFLIPFSLLVGLGTLVPHPATAPAVRAEWITAIQEFSQPFTSPMAAPHVAGAAGAPEHGYLEASALALWACGFAGVTICWLRRWRRVLALRRSARVVSVPAALGTPVPVMSVSARIEPGVFGVLRPVLLLPECILERLDETQLNAILSHEFCHVRRRDNLTAAIHMAVQAIFWFHPLTWWIGARLVAERERACDEEVLRRGCQPNVYAESILKVCRMCLSSPLACVSGVTGSDLKRRIETIMRNRREIGLNSGKKAALGVAGMATLMVPVVIGVLNAPAVWSQQQQLAGRERSQFEVASLKPDQGCESVPRFGNLSPSPGRLEMPCVTLAGLLQAAYGTFRDGATINSELLRMEGGPSWMRSEHYSLSAKADGPVRTEMLAGPMLQALLEERFRLKTHREMRQMPVYAMTVGKGGLKVQPLADGACTPLDLTHPQAPSKPGDPLPNLCGVMMMGPTPKGDMTMEVRGSTMTQFAQRLSGRVDRTVIDKTGIPGKFNFHLEFTPDPNIPAQGFLAGRGGDPGNAANPGSPAASPDQGPNLFSALQEQIGLKLSSDKGPVGFLIVDYVEKPAAN